MLCMSLDIERMEIMHVIKLFSHVNQISNFTP